MIRQLHKFLRIGAAAGRYARLSSGAVWVTLHLALGLALCTSLGAYDESTTGNQLPTLHTVGQVRKLSRQEAQRHYPVHIRATVTFFEPITPNLFVQDATGGQWVRWRPGMPRVQQGDVLDIHGETAQPDFAPDLTKATWTVVGHGQLPNPQPVTFAEMMKAEADARYVRVQGIVRSVGFVHQNPAERILNLDVALPGGPIRVIIPWNKETVPENLIDSTVQVAGTCGAMFTANNQMIGVHLFAQSLDQVVVQQPAPADPFAKKPEAIRDLLTFDHAKNWGHRVAVSGVVAATVPRQGLYMTDGTASIFLETAGHGPLQVGDEIKAVGFAGFANDHVRLESAVVRKVGSHRELKARPVTAVEALSGRYEYDLVSLEAKTVAASLVGGEELLVFEQGESLFTASFADHQSSIAVPRPGSVVKVSGICIGEANYNKRSSSAFRLLMRTPDDLVILQNGPWWTTERGLYVLGVVVAFAAFAIAWVVSLRQQVNLKTETLRATLESTQDGILVVTPDRKIVTLNRKFQELWNIPCEFARHGNDLDLLSRAATQVENENEFLAKTDEIYADEKASFHDLIELKDGRVLERHCEPQFVGGKYVGRVWSLRDITERLRVQEQERRARATAEAADRAKSEFLANMSHEIRTPMNAVIGITSALLSKPLTAEVRDGLELIQRSGALLLEVINNILDFSKIEAAKMELEKHPFELRQCVAEVVELFSARAAEKNLRLFYEVEPDVPQVIQSDVTRISQVLGNLVSNAIKFTSAGHVRVGVSCDGSRNHLHFAVSDTGIGIPVDKQLHLFTMFNQADSSTTRKYGGSGLGLAICRKISEMLGGKIWVESLPGAGSTFHFTFPVEVVGRSPGEPASAAPAVAVPAQANFETPAIAKQNLSILIAEDNLINQKVALKLLSTLGYVADLANNGQQVLEAANRKEYDVILMDVQMPDMDGLETTRRLRQRSSRKPYIIALTANAFKSDEEKCRQAGMDDFLSKPVELHALKAALERSEAIARRQSTTA